jgi:hypothetical protein
VEPRSKTQPREPSLNGTRTGLNSTENEPTTPARTRNQTVKKQLGIVRLLIDDATSK